MIGEMMIVELICLLCIFIAYIASMAGRRLFNRLSRNSLAKKIRAELSNLKTSAPNLKSTSDSSNSASP